MEQDLYTKNLENVLAEYDELIKKRDEIVKSEDYQNLQSEFAFDFLKAKNAYETLTAFKETGNLMIKFKSGQEAAFFMSNIVGVRKKSEKLLNTASVVFEKKKIEEAINALVGSSPYLPKSFLITQDSFLDEIALECLNTIPQIDKLLNKEFKESFIDSCLNSLSTEEILRLSKNKYINKNDIIKAMSREEGKSLRYSENINFIKEVFGIPEKIEKVFNTRLKGVTVEDRQHLLALLSKERPETVLLEATSEIYTPPMGNPEPSVRVTWNKKTIGFIPRDVVQNVKDTFISPEYSVILTAVIGGGEGCNYGCNVEVKIIAKGYIKQPEEIKEEPYSKEE